MTHSNAGPHTPSADRRRSVAIGATAAAFITVPNVGPLLVETAEDTERHDTAITRPATHPVSAPIFASCLASTVQAVRPSRMASAETRAIGQPLVGAYPLNTVWSVASIPQR